MPALVLDLSVEQGSTWAHGFLPQINGVNVIAAGWTARAQARTSIPNVVVLHEWTSEEGNIGVDVPSGAVTMTLSPEDSSAWNWRTAYYDLEIVSPDGEIVYRIAQGKIRVSPEVTR